MYNLNSNNDRPLQSEQLVISFLDHLCMALDLTKTQRKAAEDHYAAITELLADPSSPIEAYSPHLFPQGSFLLKTVVKPMAGVEYDVDMICLLHEVSQFSPRELFTTVTDALKRRCKDLVVKDRCCRIEYANEFHMDIIPARHEGQADSRRIVVPDRRLNDYIWSCPKLYERWFEEATQLMPKFSAEFSETVINAKSAALVEPLPDYDGMSVEPLRRFVQLFKASRNHYYQSRSCSQPSSIAITTMAAQSYRKVVTGIFYSSMIEVFRAVAEDLHNNIQIAHGDREQPLYELINPMDERENFLDCWDDDPRAYDEFRTWQSLVVRFIDEILIGTERQEGVDGAKKRMSVVFGESVASATVRSIASQRREMVSRGSAGFLASGILTTMSQPGALAVPKHTFDGIQ